METDEEFYLSDDDDLLDLTLTEAEKLKILKGSNVGRKSQGGLNGCCSKNDKKLLIQDVASISSSEDSEVNELDYIKPTFTTIQLNDADEPLVLNGSVHHTDTSQCYVVPVSVNRCLRSYQREGVQFLFDLFNRGKGSILADDMGLGKTVQVIAFLIAIKRKTCDYLDFLSSQSSGLVSSKNRQISLKTSYDQPRTPSLILAPISVIDNWVNELHIWTHFRVMKFHGKGRSECLKDLRKSRLDVVLTSCETTVNYFDQLNSIDWDCIIVDEAHKLKDSKAKVTKTLKSFKCKRRIGLSGTVLQNNMSELWCLLDWANPNCLGSWKEFRNKYVEVIDSGQSHRLTKRKLAESQKCLSKFKCVRDQWLLRRTKSIIADQLPNKVEYVIICPITEAQRNAYQNVVTSSDMQLCLTAVTNRETNIRGKTVAQLKFALLSILLKIANSLALITTTTTINNKQSCSQRQPVYNKYELEQMVFPDGVPDHLTEPSGKVLILDKMLTLFYGQKSKVLIFSYSVQLLNNLQSLIKERSYQFLRLDGKTSAADRQKLVDEFNSNQDIFIFLISTKAGGVGLNITGANVVIIFDPNWNPAHDLQAQDRAYRIGQTRDVAVYRLISECVIEEKIYLRQLYKQHIEKSTVSDKHTNRLVNKSEFIGFKNIIALRPEGESITDLVFKRENNLENHLSGLKTMAFDNCHVSGDCMTNRSDLLGFIEESDDDSNESGAQEVSEFSDNDDDDDNDDDESYLPDGLMDSVPGPSGVVDADQSLPSCVRNLLEPLGIKHHSTRKVNERSVFEEHMQKCAEKDVFQLHDNTQAMVFDCDTINEELLPNKLIKTAQKSKSNSKISKIPNCFDLNDGCYAIYGQTPISESSKQLGEMASLRNETETEFCNWIVNLSNVDREKLLVEHYVKKHPNLMKLYEDMDVHFTVSMQLEESSGVAESLSASTSAEPELTKVRILKRGDPTHNDDELPRKKLNLADLDNIFDSDPDSNTTTSVTTVVNNTEFELEDSDSDTINLHNKCSNVLPCKESFLDKLDDLFDL